MSLELNPSSLTLSPESISELNSFGCCPRCILRLSNCVNQQFYLSSENDIAGAISKYINKEVKFEKICPICLGLLQDAFISKGIFREALEKLCKETKYEVSKFSMSFHFPNSYIVRQFSSLYTLYKSKLILKKPTELTILELKDILKYILTPIVKEYLPSSEYMREANFELFYDISHPETNEDFKWLSAPLDSEKPKKRSRKEKERSSIDSSIRSLTNKLLEFNYDSPPSSFISPPSFISTYPSVTCNIKRSSIYLYGFYNKFDRYLSQTPWLIDNSTCRIVGSLSEIISKPTKKMFNAESSKFHAAGREDVNVRMLGKGRPFVVELLDSKRETLSEEELKQLEDEINQDDRVGVNNLRVCDKSTFDMLQQNAEAKKKSYVCIVQASEIITPELLHDKLDNVINLEVMQQTPIRVLHRRSLMDRKKMIYSMKTEYINSHFFILHLLSSGGTYIKEFVHSDLGRTNPSVGSLLGCECDILQLDVEELILA